MTTKIASPQDLRAELQQIITSLSSGTQPSRAKLAADLEGLSTRVAGKADIRWHDTLGEAQSKFCEETLKALSAKLRLKGRVEKGGFGNASVTLTSGSETFEANIGFKGDGASVYVTLTGTRAIELVTSPANHSPTSLAIFIVNKILAKYMSDPADRVAAADPEANDDEFNEMLALKSYERLASFAKDGLKLAKGKGGVKGAWTLVGPSLINWLAGAAGAAGDEDLSRKLKALKK